MMKPKPINAVQRGVLKELLKREAGLTHIFGRGVKQSLITRGLIEYVEDGSGQRGVYKITSAGRVVLGAVS